MSHSALPAFDIPSGSVGPGRTRSGGHWLDGFTYSLPGEARGWVTFVEARDACRAEGLGLCSVEQLDRICQSAPEVGKWETWTTSYLPQGKVWALDGGECSNRQPYSPDDQNPLRTGLCCERRPAIAVPSSSSTDRVARITHRFMTDVESAMNSREPQRVLDLAADPFLLYSERFGLRSHEIARRDLQFDLTNGSEFDNRLVRCQSRFSEEGQRGEFQCEAVVVRKMNAEPYRDLGFLTLEFRFIPPLYKYDRWAVGNRIVRKFEPIE